MKRSLLLRSLLVALVVAAAASLLTVWQQRAGAAAVGTYIVELSADPVVVAKYRAEAAGQAFDVESYRRQVVAQQNDFLARLAAKGVVFNVVGVDAPNGPAGEVSNIQFRFNYVYNGVTLEVPESALPALKKVEGVAAVHETTPFYPALDRALNYVRAPGLYGNPPKLTAFDTLDTGGVHGEGITVAVVDTGVDWTHPMFGGDPTPPQFGVGPAPAARNQKVVYYMNLTAGAVSDDFGHGTHVAADIAGYLGQAPGPDGIPGTADDVRIHGVAPQAKIMAYKTLTAVGQGLQASSIMAVEDAVQPFTVTGLPKPVPQVINLSLGGSSMSPDDPAAVACDNATLAGVTVVVAAGNAGSSTAANPTGEGTLGSPATGRRVITVGASNDPGAGANTVDDLGPGARSRMYAYLFDGSAPVTSDVTNNYVYCGLGDTPDQFPASVAGKIALIRRGGTAEAGGQSTGLVSNKVAFATAAGAVAVIVFNNVDGEISAVTARKTVIPAVGISKANGEYLLAQLGSTPGAVSPNQVRINANDFLPGMASFSSKGPVGGFGQVKPDVVAPGEAILSATVRAGGVEAAASAGVPPGVGYALMMDPTGYTSASGTSFACPITAGVAALVKQKHPTWTPAMIRAALVNTATNLRRADGTAVADGTQTLNQQGGGLIDAGAAANAKALLGTGAPGPVTGGATTRAFAVGLGPLAGKTPGNPDFSPSYSFAAVPVAGVEGAAVLTQTVSVYDISGGGGAGTYDLSVSNVRGVDGRDVRVSLSNADGGTAAFVDVLQGRSASFKVNVNVNGAKLADATQIEWYVTATHGDGTRYRMPFYLRAVRPTVATAAPAMGDVTGNEVADATPVDINGAYRLTFAKPSTGAQAAKLRVQESADGGATWATLADVDASQTAYDVAGRANGAYQYRAVALYAVEYGLLAGPPSAPKEVRVDRRVEQDVTSLVQAAIVDGTVNFSGGVAEFEQTLRNASASGLYAPLRFVITSVQSNSGRVRVSNADNGGAGAAGSPAAFDYSTTFGPDFAPNELSAAKRLRFANPSTELFQFTAVVYAHVPDPAFAQGGSASGTGAPGTSSSPSDGGTTTAPTTGTLGTPPQTKVLTFRVNPLTGKVSLL